MVNRRPETRLLSRRYDAAAALVAITAAYVAVVAVLIALALR